jgi:hypothetical protein
MHGVMVNSMPKKEATPAELASVGARVSPHRLGIHSIANAYIISQFTPFGQKSEPPGQGFSNWRSIAVP